MRIYAEADPAAVLAGLLGDPAVAEAVVAHRRLPARAADLLPLPGWLDPRIRAALEGRGYAGLYRHQAEAIDALRGGSDVCVVTPTASGKSLCYDLPVLQAIAEDPSARALYIFPTKALGQDQTAELRDLAEAARLDIAAAVYDGDTPAPIRSSIRSAGQVVVTNPDMLHAAILPHHTKWFQLFEQLRYVVVDEAHTYRGVFGGHVANVLRRLLRLCAHYGSTPRVITCSATIGNPATLAELLSGRRPALIDRNGAPSGEKHVLVLNPPMVDAQLGARASAFGLAERVALGFLRAGRQTIVFGRSRTSVEILLSRLREALRDGRGPSERVRGYRGGYLPSERRAIERGLRTGDILGVVSTNALELGIDIGRLDAAVLAGYPGSIAATWQQMGRAGRRQEVSVAVLVATSGPVDQYVAAHPEYLFEATPEEARLDPDNLHVLLAHLRAAAFELPFESGEVFGPGPADELLAFLGEEGHVRRADDGRWYWASENFPAAEISLRTGAPENVVIIDLGPAGRGERPRVIGEVDLFSAPTLVHEDAVYLHESRQFHVERLDWEERKAYVRPVDVDHYTQAEVAVTLKPLETFASGTVPAGERAHGEVMVSSLATIYKKLKLDTAENLGWGRIHLPELELHTTAYWLALEPGAVEGWRRDELDVALVGAGRALRTVASVLLMSDPRDLGLVAQVRSPHFERPLIYLYDSVPGGVGLAQRLFDRHAELIEGARDLVRDCACGAGCPACTGPRLETGGDGKRLALRLLADLAGATPARAA
ncbi:MAG TPA: DEAD/DEAH box helicase [Candidatus Limnocylindrales bacterium]|nr:DEAD/DEAH box helicase [Candidatus Limnocylindrales bacterium]